MKTLYSFLWALVIIFFPLASYAFTPPPAPTDGFLVDSADLLTQAEQTKIKAKLNAINKDTETEIAVLILPTLAGESIEDVAYTTFNTWKIGKQGKDNGVLLVISLQPRKMRIETGKGVGGELTDVQSKQIINQIAPSFKNKQFAHGIEVGVDLIAGTLDPRKGPGVANSSPSDAATGGIIFLVVFGLLGLVMFIIYLISRSGGKRSYSSGYSGYSGGYSGYSSSSSSSGGFFSGGSDSSSSSSFGGGESGGGGASGDW